MALTRTRMPDLDALALLLAVADIGSVGGAARRLGITQPAASLRIRGLEQQLGTVLLTRTPTGSTLTASGSIVAGWAAPLVRSAVDFGRNVAALTEKHRERLRVAASLTIADHLVPGWLVAFHALMPGISVSMQPVNSERAAELVQSGEIDIGFVEGADAPNGLRSRIIGQDDLVLVVAPAHRWARRGVSVSAEQLSTAPLVLREPGSGTREVLERALAGQAGAARPALEMGSTAAIKAAVIGGRDGAVLSRLAVRAELADGTLVTVPTPDLDLRRQFRAIWKSGRSPSGPANALLALCIRMKPDR